MFNTLIKRLNSEIKSIFTKTDDPSRLRTQQFKKSLITSLAGKGISISAQLIAVPVAISALGVERFGVYAILTALLNWINMATMGISPSLTVQIITAHADNDKKNETEVFTTAFLFSAIVSITLIILIQSFIRVIGVESLFGAKLHNHSLELQEGLFVLSFFMAANIILSVIEAAQAGYQNQYLNNIFLSVGSLATILIIFLVVKNWPTIPNMILAVFGAPMLARIINLVNLFRNHEYLIPRFKNFKLPLLKVLLSTGSTFLLTQLGSFLYQNATVYLVGRKLGATSAAHMSVMMLVLSLSGSLLIMLTQPLWPAIQDATTRGDYNWAKMTYNKILRNFVPYIAVIAFIISTYGSYFVELWMKTSAEIPHLTQFLWGVYFFLVAWEHINYSFLLGLGKYWVASSSFLFGALIMLISSIYLVEMWGLSGIFSAMCMGPLLLTVWLYPYAIKRIFLENSHKCNFS